MVRRFERMRAAHLNGGVRLEILASHQNSQLHMNRSGLAPEIQLCVNGPHDEAGEPFATAIFAPSVEYFVTRMETAVAYLAWLFGGGLGLHQLCLGNYARAAFYGQTFGGFGLLWLVDAFILPSQLRAKSGTMRIAVSPSGWRLALVFISQLSLGRLYGWIAHSWTVFADEDVRGLEDVVHRRVALALLMALATLASLVAGAAWRTRPPVLSTGVIASAIICAYSFAPPEIELSASEVTGYAAALAGGASWWFFGRGRAREMSPVRETAPVARSACRRCGLSLVSLTGVAVFWAAAFVGLLLQFQVPLGPDGSLDPMSVRSVKLGPFLWQNRARVWEELRKGRDWFEHRSRSGDGSDHSSYFRFAGGFFRGAAQSLGSGGTRSDLSLLGIDPASEATLTLPELKQRHRAALKLHHPDRLPPSASHEVRLQAADRFRAIQSAYERLHRRLQRRRG